MNIKVGKHLIELNKDDLINEKEINITKCYFTFDEEITNDFVKEAYFTLNKGTTYKKIIVNNECDLPSEILREKGIVELGVVAYYIDENDNETRYNPSSCFFETLSGSLKTATNSQPITPSEMEQYEQALNDGLLEVQNVDIDASKSGSTATITITNRNGTTKQVQVSDGINGQNGKDGKDGTNGTNGTNGVSIVSVTKTSTSGLVDTYTISYSNTNTSTFNVTNGANGQDGSNYVLTTADKNEIAGIVLSELQTVDEVGY